MAIIVTEYAIIFLYIMFKKCPSMGNIAPALGVETTLVS